MTTEGTRLNEILYPPIDPYAAGMLNVGDGQEIYWEECGDPRGKPALFLHGGPGGALTADYRRYFDPSKYRVILFDQRQCGRSLPHAASPGADLSANTTWRLVEDIEQIRTDRGVQRWQVFGGSWGSALALAYAEAYPERVTELVLRGIFTLRRSELNWYYNGGAGNLSPLCWESFLAPLGPGFSGDCISAYHELLFNPDPAIHLPAGKAWTTWEAATSQLVFSQQHVDEFSDPSYALAFARIENHYFVNGGFFREGQLIAEADRLRDIPGVIVQGKYDLCCPITTAVALHRAWPQADYLPVLAGHSISEPAIAAELVAATDRYAE
ncbi:MAG: prolyl aminopeptidase [Propionibacteriaceae bacterium]|jgi:proline iminopeptidase|nr:prolyl aminopeptidase [Propionibacteriaceae bacterium]